LSRQVVKSATKKKLLELGFPEPIAHDLARGMKVTELLQLSYNEPLHEETTMTPRQIIENSEQTFRDTWGGWGLSEEQFDEKRLSEAISNLNRLKMKKFGESWSIKKIEESGYLDYYGIERKVVIVYNSFSFSSSSFFSIPLPAMVSKSWSQTPKEIRELIRRFPKWEAEMRSIHYWYSELQGDRITLSLNEFLKSYDEEWSAYIEGKLWPVQSPWERSLNFPRGFGRNL
jgi:hypothetical protein